MIKIHMEAYKNSTIELKGRDSKLWFELFVMLEELSKELPDDLWFAVLMEHMEELKKRLEEDKKNESK